MKREILIDGEVINGVFFSLDEIDQEKIRLYKLVRDRILGKDKLNRVATLMMCLKGDLNINFPEIPWYSGLIDEKLLGK